jgi:HSP20 family protein
MAKKKTKKEEDKGLEPSVVSRWPSPFERIEELFEDFFRRSFRPWFPSFPRLFEEMKPTPTVDIFEDGDDIVVKSELPGMTKDDIEVNITENTITISGEKKSEEKIEKKNYYRLERSYGSFCRSFDLPVKIQPDKAKASFKDGVLEVRLPKSEEAKKRVRKITIE